MRKHILFLAVFLSVCIAGLYSGSIQFDPVANKLLSLLKASKIYDDVDGTYANVGAHLAATMTASTAYTKDQTTSLFVPQTRTVAGHALSSNVTVSKSDVGLSSVENTALSTWADSANITTVGTLVGYYSADSCSGLYVPLTRTINGSALSSNVTLTTANVADSADKRYCTDAQKVVIGNTSGANTGDETQTTIRNKLQAASAANSGYMLDTDYTSLTGHLVNTSNPHSVTKTQVGLANVENTALSTWAGSGNITTLGTISSGSIPWANVDKTTSSLANITTRNATDLTTQASTYYNVDGNRADTYTADGTSLKPYKTIQAALDVATDGVCLMVYPGSYAENLSVTKNVSIRGCSAGVVGSKITITGDVVLNKDGGELNLTNLHVAGNVYGTANPAWSYSTLEIFGCDIGGYIWDGGQDSFSLTVDNSFMVNTANVKPSICFTGTGAGTLKVLLSHIYAEGQRNIDIQNCNAYICGCTIEHGTAGVWNSYFSYTAANTADIILQNNNISGTTDAIYIDSNPAIINNISNNTISGNITAGNSTTTLTGNIKTSCSITGTAVTNNDVDDWTGSTDVVTVGNLLSAAQGSIYYSTGTELAELPADSGKYLRSNGAAAPSWETPSGGGMWTLVARQNIAAAVTAVGFYDLDGDTDMRYMAKCRYVSAYNGTSECNMLCNSDSGANYTILSMTELGGPNFIGAAAINQSNVYRVGLSREQNSFSFSTIEIDAKSGIYRMLTKQLVAYSSSENDNTYTTSGHIWRNSADNLTSLVFVGSQTNAIGIGSVFELWKLAQ